MTAFRSLTAACALALFSAVSPARAETLSDTIRIEILDGGATARGTHLAGIRLSLKPGWKTYWRSPGDAGIPPEFAWRGSRNLDTVAIGWPTPRAFEQSGLRSIGYTGSVVLPLELTPKEQGGEIHLSGSIDMGVCKDICIPEHVSFDVTLDPDAPRNPAIAAALAERPYSEREAGVKSASCALTPTEDGLRIETRITMPPSGGTEVAVIEPGNPMIWASEAETSRRGDVLTAASELIHVDGSPIAIDRSKVRVTVLGSKYAVDIKGCTAG